jgi:hypothetical protein
MAGRAPAEWPSVTEYRFDKKDSDAIIRATSEQFKQHTQSVIWFPHSHHVKIRSSIATPFERTSNADLGSLELPLELLQDILSRLDIHSLFKFRQVNSSSRLAVDSLPQYKRAVDHGLNLFCALLRTGRAKHISILDVDEVLCAKACAFCGTFGNLVALLAWKRCCFLCLQHVPELQVRPLARVRRHLLSLRCTPPQLLLTEAKADQLASFKTVPGIYSRSSVPGGRLTVVSSLQALSVCGLQPNEISFSLRGSLGQDGYGYNYMGACALPYYDKANKKVEAGISCAGCRRFGTAPSGTTNVRERIAWPALELFTEDGFLQHFRWCPLAQRIWSSDTNPNPRIELRTRSVYRSRAL